MRILLIVAECHSWGRRCVLYTDALRRSVGEVDRGQVLRLPNVPWTL